MRSVLSSVETELATKHAVQTSVRVIADFSHNRTAFDVEATNPDTTFEDPMYPIDSIIGAHRPRGGIPWLVVGQGMVRDPDTTDVRFRTPNLDSQYKYYRSPRPTYNNVVAQFAPTVTYNTGMLTNKIRVQFETADGLATPDSIEVWYDTSTSDPMVSLGTFTCDHTGRLDLYRQSDGSWSKTTAYNEGIDIRRIRVTIPNGPEGSHVNLVELDARYTVVFGPDDLTGLDISMSREEVSPRNPLGVMAANTCTFTLTNHDDRFNYNNASSDLYKLLGEDVMIQVDFGVVTGSSTNWVTQGRFYTEAWQPDLAGGTMSVQCKDISKYLQTTTVQECIFVDRPAAEIIRDLLEMHGYSDLALNVAGDDTDYRIPYVWFNDQETLWEALKSVVEADHGALWVDWNGTINYQSKRAIYEADSVATFTSVDTAEQRSNLFSLNYQFEKVFNSVKVNYETFKPNTTVFGTVVNSELWTPGESLSLRASPLTASIANGSTLDVRIDPDEIATWPYEGKFNIGGEIFYYDGLYVSPDGSDTGKVVKRNEKKYPEYEYTGQFNVTDRGMEGSIRSAHTIDSDGWGITRFRKATVNSLALGGATKQIVDGRLQLETVAATSGYTVYTATTRGIDTDAYEVYATKVRFPSSAAGYKNNIAGLMFHRQSGTSPEGYFIEVVHNDFKTMRNDEIGNIRCYKIQDGDVIGLPRVEDDNTFVPPNVEEGGVRGYDKSIEYDHDYQVEAVVYQWEGNQHVAVFVNGQYITGFSDNTFTSGLWGMFVRGHTKAQFEYFMCHKSNFFGRPPTDQSQHDQAMVSRRLYDRQTGDYISGYVAGERSGAQDYDKWFFDEFGPIVHERRDFDIEHNIAPSFGNFLFHSNEAGAQVVKFYTSPFRTRFTMDNSSRRLAVLNGTDPNAIEGEEVTYIFALLGQALVREEVQFQQVQNENSIRQHGINELEINSPWIQNADRALEVGLFIRSAWGQPVDVVEVQVFPNLGLEPGDLVTIDYPEKDIDDDYFVSALNYSWANGITCNLTLRRRRV